MKKWELEAIDAAAQAIGMHARLDEDGTLRIENVHGVWAYKQEDATQALTDIAAVACLIESDKKNDFLRQALEELDGFDGALLAQDFYAYIVRRDGSCPYSLEELDTWLDEK